MPRRLLALLALLLLAATAPAASAAVASPARQDDDGAPSDESVAPQPPPPDWLPTGLTAPVSELSTPASGAFFARVERGLVRSDDGGATWRAVTLPGPQTPESGALAVDPSDHRRLLVGRPDGLYRSVDDARTWSLVYPLAHRHVQRVAISPADGRVVYMALVGEQFGPTESSQGHFWFLRSTDGGATFAEVEHRSGTTCAMSVPVLAPHPGDPRTVFRAAGCLAGRTYNMSLDVSRDGGATFATSLFDTAELARAVVGGGGGLPDRFYAAMNRDPRFGGSTLYRSDDGAASWAPVLVYRNAHMLDGRNVPPVTTLAGVASDPARPDRVWVALGDDGDGVQFSPDGGATWQDAGGNGLGTARALALGVDGRNLYLATDQGLWRQPVDPGEPG